MLLVSSSSHIFVRDKPVHGQSVEGFGSRMNSGRKPSGSCVLSAARIGSTVLPVLLDVVCITANLAIRRGGLFCPCFGYFCPRLALCCPLPRRVLSASFAGLSTILRRLSGSVVKRLFDFFLRGGVSLPLALFGGLLRVRGMWGVELFTEVDFFTHLPLVGVHP